MKQGDSILFQLLVCFCVVAAGALFGMSVYASEVDKMGCGDKSYYNFEIAPAFIDSVPADYKAVARRALIEGRVTLKVFVTNKGLVCDVIILEGYNPFFDGAAKRAAEKSTFSPATTGGKKTNGSLNAVYTFSLEEWHKGHLRKFIPPLDSEPPLISDLGTQISGSNRNLEIQPRFWFENTTFVGDVSLRVFRSIEKQIGPKLGEGEEVRKVTHHLGLPSKGRAHYIYVGDLEVETCNKISGQEGCNGGGNFYFLNSSGEYRLMEEVNVRWQ